MILIIIVLGDDMEYVILISRTLIFYVLIICVYRVLGKREVGELSIIDLLVSIFIIELAIISIDEYESNILLSIVPILFLVFVQILVDKLNFKKKRVRNVIEGGPSVIINRGKLNFSEMLKQRYNLDDILVELRGNGVKSIEEVDYAILETSGDLSVFLKDDDNSYPLPIIMDGVLLDESLIQISKSEIWLKKVLDEEGIILKDVFYGFYKNDELFLIKKKDIS